MARVTVEDCVLKVPNRFELVMLASQRARDIGAGSPLTVERDNDKNTVVSLREIADTEIDLGALRDALVRGHQKVMEIEEAQDEILDVMEGEAEWAEAARQDAAHELSADLADEAEEVAEAAPQGQADDMADEAV